MRHLCFAVLFGTMLVSATGAPPTVAFGGDEKKEKPVFPIALLAWRSAFLVLKIGHTGA